MRAVDAFDVIRGDARLDQLSRRIAGPAQGPVIADGQWGSSARILAGLATERLGRPLLFVTAHTDEADEARDDLELVLGRGVELLPPLEGLPGEQAGDDELAAERLRLCLKLIEAGGTPALAEAGGFEAGTAAGPAGVRPKADAEAPLCIVAPILALMQPVPSRQAIAEASLHLVAGGRREHSSWEPVPQVAGEVPQVAGAAPPSPGTPEQIVQWLVAHGFKRCDQVELPGDFAHRGGIVDIFGHAHDNPVRIEFFGDQIESIRLFDAGTNRSAQRVDEIRIPAPAVLGGGRSRPAGHSQTTSFLSLLPAETVIAIHEPGEVQELGRTYFQRLGERAGVIPAEAVLRRAAQFAQLHLRRFAGGEEGVVHCGAESLPQFEPRAADVVRGLVELGAQADVVVFCENAAERQRFSEWLAENRAGRVSDRAGGGAAAGEEAQRPGGAADELSGAQLARLERVRGVVGLLSRGFVWSEAAAGDERPARRTAFVPHHELFSRISQRRTLRRMAPARPIDSFFDLSAGDHVVHALHGIGRFQGLKTIERGERREEYMALEFADSAVLHVPTSQVHVVQKYIGGFRGKPALSKLGGQAWKRTKQRVAESVTDLAAELLAIHAQRETQPGIAYPGDTRWQREFEEAFPYPETEDQLRALAEIKSDMGRPRPMDRLLCGDVGYGKTELAIRSAFKVVEYGKQVAVLVPTTVLAEQHYHTFRERMAEYPFVIEMLSRFRTKGEQSRIVERARKGQVDVLIGTHRLLSADVRFADLGLVIIDEEQRFGVEAKEKLKQLRSTVDVLTLSATPIPRTLHMSMLGIRDISSLATAPVDRRAIVTQVRMWDDVLIREAILRELNRDGQVYFVHNFVRDIHTIANHVRSLVPEARIVVGHGQMGSGELEQVMLAFVRREADILVSTSIIESGLDIPSANTIFINRAERFGLAELHQLRGRVGRSKHRAYCYLMLSPRHPLTDIAARRLKAIEHYSQLGAGFQIAMRDLEIRGAGNILGAEQSGNIEAVGYEMYCELLEQAKRRLRNEPAEAWRQVNLELGVPAVIPRSYIRAERQRMEVYKRSASCRSLADVQTLRDELRDVYGPPPPEAETLLTLAEIRVLAQPWGIRSLVLVPPDVIFSVDDLRRVEPLLSSGPGSPRVPDAHTIHWRLPKHLLEPERLLAVLRAQLAAGAGEAAGAAGVADRAGVAVPAGRG